ncbi:hypothetical protein EST38_g9442 [Candolleomyces aberdarensis]|uniref:Uncharacterized protein n=1 Tax=Candolleomyces aberdarensis TaxID=2316362 RepID=A0A4Q2DCU5_9AGAR|nr:hypothetical protein EST38_g9442 [Candolleomyces aberdarensis]
MTGPHEGPSKDKKVKKKVFLGEGDVLNLALSIGQTQEDSVQQKKEKNSKTKELTKVKASASRKHSERKDKLAETKTLLASKRAKAKKEKAKKRKSQKGSAALPSAPGSEAATKPGRKSVSFA